MKKISALPSNLVVFNIIKAHFKKDNVDTIEK